MDIKLVNTTKRKLVAEVSVVYEGHEEIFSYAKSLVQLTPTRVEITLSEGDSDES